MQNSQNQSQLKTLKPKERTYTLHNDAFSAPGNSNLVDCLKMNNDFDIHQLQYAPISNMFTPSSYGLPQYFIPFSNTFQNHQTTIAEQLIQNSQPLFLGTLPLKNLAPEGMRIVCEIDIIMLKNYYDLREQIFNKHNQPASKRMDSKSNQVEWIKGRFQYRFRDNISKMFCSMVDEIKSLHNNKTEDGYLNQVEKLNFEPSELFILDKEMKEKNLQNKEYLDPNEIGRRIIKLIDMYIKTSNQ